MLRSNLLFQTLRASKISGASSVTARRCFGASTGHGHGHAAHAPAGPYDVPHHPSQPDEAYPFGINPNAEYKYEGWEFVTLGTYLICFGILFIGSMTSDKNAFKNWAKTEALARREVRANGGEVEFGKWYSRVEYELTDEDSIGVPPTIKSNF